MLKSLTLICGLLICSQAFAQKPQLTVVPVLDEGKESTSTLSLQFTLSSPPQKQASIQLQTRDITATGGQDYVPVVQPVIFPKGVSVKTVNIQLLDDNVDELREERFLLNYHTPVNLVVASQPKELIVKDDDEEVSVTSVSNEEGKKAKIKLMRKFRSTHSTGFKVELKPGTAKEGEDYELGQKEFMFAPNETEKTVLVNLKDDEKIEGTENFQAKVTPVKTIQDNYTLKPQTLPLSIVDNDGELVVRFHSEHHVDTRKGPMEFTYDTKQIALERVEKEGHLFFRSKKVTPETSLVLPRFGASDSKGGDFQVVKLQTKEEGQAFTAQNLKLHYSWGQDKAPSCKVVDRWQECYWNGMFKGLHVHEKHPRDFRLPGNNYITDNFDTGSASQGILEAQKKYELVKGPLTETTKIQILRVKK